MANFGGHYPYSYDAYPLMTEDEDEDEDEMLDIKPLLVGGVLRPNPLSASAPVTLYNFDPSPSTSFAPPPLHPSPNVINNPQISCSSSQAHGGPQLSNKNSQGPGSYDGDFQDRGAIPGLDDDATRSQGPRLNCRFCGRHFNCDSNRAIHEQTHSRDRPFVCSYCGRTFSFKHSMLRHERTVHRDEVLEGPPVVPTPQKAAEAPRFQDAPRPAPIAEVAADPRCSTTHVAAPPPVVATSDLSCQHCGSRFMNHSALVKHEKMHTGEPAFRCSFCAKGFSFKESLVRHERSEHGQAIQSVPLAPPNPLVKMAAVAANLPLVAGLTPVIQEADLQNYQCRYCGKIWRNREYLKIHMRTHTGEKPFKCSYCDMRFSVRTNMQRHERNVHRKENEHIPAPIQKPAKSSTDVLGPRPTPRSIPDMVEPSDVSFIKFDSKLNGYPCSYCSKSFPERDRLKIHVRSHTGEKPYKCKHCHMCFSVRGNRNRHEIRVHRGVAQSTPTFRQSAEKFVASKKKLPFKCSHCDEAFSSLSLVVKHERRKHFKLRIPKPAAPCQKAGPGVGSPTYECCFCQQQFNHVGNMYKHQRRMHAHQLAQEGCSTSEDPAPPSLAEVKNQGKQYSCNLCGMSFDSQDSVLKHEASEHAQLLSDECIEAISLSEALQPAFEIKTEIDVDSEELRIRCTFCEEIFTQRSEMYEHLTQAHAHLFPDSSNSLIISPPAPKRVKMARLANVRMKNVERTEQFKCGYCHQVFQSRSSAIQHENLMHPMLLPHEDEETPHSSSEAKVMQEILNCYYCQQSFTLRTNLLRHLKEMHSGEEVIDLSSDNIQVPSQKTKRKRKKFKCPYCVKTITGLWGWRRHAHRAHLKSVANEDVEAYKSSTKRSFECSFCDMSFTRSVIWRRHEIRRHFNLLSDRAAETAALSKSLQPTLETNDGPNTSSFKCSYCDKSYLSRSAKLLHERRMHDSTSTSQATPEACGYTNSVAESDNYEAEVNRRYSDGMISKSINKSFDNTEATQRRYSDESALKSSYKKFSVDTALKKVNDETFNESTSSEAKVVIPKMPNEYNSKSEPCNSSNPGSPSKYRCQYCGLQRLDRYRLIVHERSHTGERPFKCSLCGKGFAENFVMNRHKREVHFKEKSSRKKTFFQCAMCPIQLNSAIALQQHERIHSADLPFACNFCERTFATAARLNRHKGAMHKGYRRIEEEQSFNCDLCWKSFFSETQLNHHRDTEHEEDCSVEEEQSFDCDSCGKSFFSEAQLKEHKDTEHENDSSVKAEQSFDCDICGKSFPEAGRLSRHKGAVHKGYRRADFFDCDFCTKAFPTLGRLSRHKRTVHKQDHSIEEQSFDCYLCEKSFLSPGQLSQHRDAEHIEENYSADEQQEETPYHCDLCLKSFPTVGRLSRHKGAVHKGYRNLEKQSFDCNLCVKSFPSARSLIQHKGAKHKGENRRIEEKPTFNCDLCYESFHSAMQLNQHKDVDHKDMDCGVEQKQSFDCNLCDKSFPSNRSLIQHKGAKHKGENRRVEEKQVFSCDLCDKFFPSSVQLNQHRKTDHKEGTSEEVLPEDQSFDCNLCGKSFVSAICLQSHKYAEHKEENCSVEKVPPVGHSFDCDICGKSFPAAGRLTRHKSAVHRVKLTATGRSISPIRSLSPTRSGTLGLLICTFCGIRFKDRRRFANHLRRHTGSQPFGCSICGRRFSCGQFLLRHKREFHKKKRSWRLSPRPFACNQCCLTFNTESRLQNHLNVHIDGVKFTCDICGACFRAKSSFYEHKKIMHK